MRSYSLNLTKNCIGFQSTTASSMYFNDKEELSNSEYVCETVDTVSVYHYKCFSTFCNIAQARVR